MGKMFLRCLSIGCFFFFAAAAVAGQAVNVSHPWVGATHPGQTVAGAYMELESPTEAALVTVKTPMAKSAEIHAMSMEGGVMKMRQLDKLPLPAGKVVKLGPGGYHLMLVGIKKPLKEGDKVPLALTVEGTGGKRTVVEVEAEVREAEGRSMH